MEKINAYEIHLKVKRESESESELEQNKQMNKKIHAKNLIGVNSN